MPILNYTTKVDPAVTIGQITKTLTEKGARKIVMDNDENGLLISITFSLEIRGNMIFYALPCNWQGVLKAMQNDSQVPNKFCNKEQSIRVAWRIIKDWIEAQMAIVEAQLATVPEIFLPYVVLKNGKTLYQHFEENPQKLFE
ncbi:hypothetical protein [Adhaeribacter pallidiroseus]|uniref:Uncharacterized protein n=1 Tax=Adhaeribacter pallidiroseus TaxID=2072847 RepID=A0A369QG72_9BACT|nr:hypothetical protein [Adhaeribacter pallidiroseus]RDC63300.1 hypothetical protein AHMF7616_01902 [Adhaeribacter pallidiroseus]